MNGIKFLLDTNIVIGLLKGNDDATTEILNKFNCSLSECAVSQITRMELLSYPSLKSDEENHINQFLSVISVLMLDQSVEQKTINYRRKQGGKLPDAIIAATALNHQLKLLTLDKKMSKLINNC